MTIEILPRGQRPQLQQPSAPQWPVLIETQVHPVKVAIIEALHWVGGPLSAHEVWLMEVGAELSTVAYHVKTLVELGILTHVAEAPVRGSLEKFHVLTPAK